MGERDWAEDVARVLTRYSEANYAEVGGRERTHEAVASALRLERSRGYEQGRLDALVDVLRSAGLASLDDPKRGEGG